MKKKKIFLCGINNIKSGGCSEDCRFCTQSARYRADIESHPFKSIQSVVGEAERAKEYGISGYCLVSSGKDLDDSRTEYLAHLAAVLRSVMGEVRLIACAGTAKKENLLYLKKNGIESYNHNLETSKNFYGNICTTHSWDERYATCEAVKSVGLSLCCGGIFGLGESRKDRMELLDSISSLDPESVPINFYIPNKSLPIKKSAIKKDEALELIKSVSKTVTSAKIIMIAGGREMLFGKDLEEIFAAGANSIVIGDYLTTAGESPHSDIHSINDLGYEIAGRCNEQ